MSNVIQIPTGSPVAYFIPTQTFTSEMLKSTYVKGMQYTLREGDIELAVEMQDWEEDGLIQVIEV